MQQAADLCAKWQIQPAAIFCSELKRAHQSAQAFSAHYQPAPRVLSTLNEFRCLDFKTVEGLQGAERAVLA